jgi:hypothetical protein
MKAAAIVMMMTFSELSAQTYFAMRAGFLDRKGEVERMRLLPAGETATTRTVDFVLQSTTGDSIGGRMRIPRGSGPHPAALLCVGLETGKDVIAMIEGQEHVLLMAIDYPFEGELNFSGWAAVGATFRLRSMAYRTVPLLLNCFDWLFEQPFVDRNEVTMVAVSFGVFTGVPAAVIDQRVKQLVVVQGGSNLSGVIAHNSERWGAPVPSWLAGWLGGAILGPFEPNKYIPYLAPRFLLMVSSEGDSMFPRSSAEAMFAAAREPKEIVWHHSGHVMPGERERIRELTTIVVDRLYGDGK